MSDDPHIRGGRPELVLPGLFERLRGHSPELAGALKAHLDQSPDRPQPTTYDGADSSVKCLLHLLEALVAFEQVRLEILDQMSQCHHRGEAPPSRYSFLLSQLLGLEPVLIQAGKSSVELHTTLWGVGRSVGEPLIGEPPKRRRGPKR